jgi:hypothetical protein
LKINIEQAAEILRVDTQTVRALIDNGVLMPYKARPGKGSYSADIHFTPFIIEGFKRQFDGDISLARAVVSSRVAIKMIGLTQCQFSSKWVRTERLKPIQLKEEGRPRYFLREDVIAVANSSVMI